MSCERPLSIINPRYKGLTKLERYQYAEETWGTPSPPDEYIEVPCGHCRGCEKSNQYAYSMRLMYELHSHPPGSCLFVTLTFDKNSLEKFNDNLNKPVLRFLDVLRKKYGKSIRHWFVCEFGKLKGRPHYHGILFNCPKEILSAFHSYKVGCNLIIDKYWKYGITFTGYVSDETCKYVSKYVSKSLNGRNIRPRIISSTGIGLSYLDTPEAELHKNNGLCNPLILVGGVPMALPRYYYNKIFSFIDRQNMALDRYIDGKFYWKGIAYDSQRERDQVRALSYFSNVQNGLSFRDKFPSKKIIHKNSKLFNYNSNE